MKKITMMALLMSGILGFSQNQSNGAVSTTIAPASTIVTGANVERFRFGSGLVTQLDTGTDFDFTAASQWLSFGKLSTPGQTLYGYRAQRAGRGLIFGFTGAPQTGAPTTGTPVIEWVGNGTSTAGDLLFRTSPSSTSATSTQVMKMRANGTSVFGNTSVYEDGDYAATYFPVFAPVTNTKVEINQNDNSFGSALSIFRKGNYSSSFTDRVYGASFYNTNLNTSSTLTRVYGLSAQGVNTDGGAYGLEAIGRTTSTSQGSNSTGIIAFGRGGRTTIGVSASANSSAGITNSICTGFRSDVGSTSATSSASCYGVFASLQGSTITSSLNYAIYGTATGINNFAGYFNGRIFSTSALVVSDKTLKKDVKVEESVIEKLSKLKPVTYNFISDKKQTGLNLSDKLQHGFIAQELAEVFPELVEDILNPIFNDKNEQIGTQNLKAVNYIGLISVLTSSINEMSNKIAVLEEKLKKNETTYVVSDTKKFSDSELLNIEKSSYSLAQNVPNPFSTSTIINYSLPENEKNAKILILNLNGQLIKEYNLNEIKGQLIVEAGLLQKGMYLYSLISNNEEIITKKMIVN